MLSRNVKLVTSTLLAIVGLPLFSQTARASSIAWGTPQNISGDSDVSTTGTLVGAFNVGGPGVPNTTVNGVTFVGFPLSGNTSVSGNFSLSSSAGFASNNNDTTGSAPFSTLSAGYQTLLESFAGNITDPFTLTISGLSTGSIYQFEWWVNATSTSVVDVTGTAGGAVTLSSDTTGADGGLGQYALGTFIADSTGSETITFSGPGTTNVILDAFELSQTAVPEPGSVALLCGGLGLLLLLLKLRRLASIF